MQRHVAEPLGLSLTEAAWGIFQVLSESMASAARVHFAEKGRDPRRYALFAYGGGGPLHAAIVARRLRITRVIVPFGEELARLMPPQAQSGCASTERGFHSMR